MQLDGPDENYMFSNFLKSPQNDQGISTDPTFLKLNDSTL